MPSLWRTEWKALNARIHGLLEATTLYLRAERISTDDAFGTSKKHILPQSLDIFESLKALGRDYGDGLPTEARRCLERFVANNESLFAAGDDLGLPMVKARLTALGAFRSEFEYHVSDFEALARRQVERAFLHLQRSIVADEAIREKWHRAFAAGDLACEKLGAAHLLAHGLWAFKVSGAGERTDLVMGDRLTDLSQVDRVADALVLTEWKLIRDVSELDARAAEALGQARRYSRGVLAGVELHSVRYLVLVSTEFVAVPESKADADDVLFRYVNIAVTPSVPSRQTL